MEVFIDVVGGRKKQNGTLNAFFIEPIHRLLLLCRRNDKTESGLVPQKQSRAAQPVFYVDTKAKVRTADTNNLETLNQLI